MSRKIIPYNPKLKELAKKLRQNMTYSEVVLSNEPLIKTLPLPGGAKLGSYKI
jgi:hypothetical protein